MRRLLAVLVVLVGAAGGAASVSAAPVPVATQQAIAAKAEAFYAGSSCAGRVTWRNGPMWGYVGSLDAQLVAGRPYARPAGVALVGECVAVMDEEITSPYEWCVVFFHERGHLAGLDHDSPFGEGIMAAVEIADRPWGPCLEFGQPLRPDEVRGDHPRGMRRVALGEAKDAAWELADDMPRRVFAGKSFVVCERAAAQVSPEKRLCWVRWKSKGGRWGMWRAFRVDRSYDDGQWDVAGWRLRRLDSWERPAGTI